MRTIRVVFLTVALCLPALARADSLTSISPSQQYVDDVEEFVTLSGSGLVGSDSTLVVFTGPAGTFSVEPNNASSSSLQVWVPIPVAVNTGTYSVTVQATDTGMPPRVIGPVTFQVIDRPPIVLPPTLPEVVTAEATSPSGAIVTFETNGASCDHTSGSLFPLGSTTVTCTAGSLTATFLVVVTDTTPPVLTIPPDIHVLSDPVVTFTATAVDNIDGTLPVSCDPASGSTFPAGTTTVRCVATDAHLNQAVGLFNVTVSPDPVLTLPPNIIAEAQSAAGATVNYTATADLGATVACAPPSGSIFPLGTTTVNCLATAPSTTTSSGSFTVTVVDTLPPALTLPADMTVQATSAAGANVTFTATATDLVDGPVPVSCTPASGSLFPFGTTQVFCGATDAHHNGTGGLFKVTVEDTTPPVLNLPGPLSIEATSAAGATVTYTATATDNVDGSVPISCTPASGSQFAFGTATVNCSATDSHGNQAHGSFTVTVADTTPPTLTLPSSPITVEATSASGAVVTFTATATDNIDGSVPVTCTPTSGSTFPLGTTTVQCSATDAHHNTAHGSITVDVQDTTPPQILSVTASPSVLWPDNHKMVPVTIAMNAQDAVDPAPFNHILSVTSDQPINGTGDGNTSPDWEITGPLTLNLRAERTAGRDRTYTITVESTDASGNSSTATVTVKVAQLRGRPAR